MRHIITLKPNTNDTLNTLCHKDAVISYYYSICEDYANNHIQLFITDLQTLITKVGMIMSEVSTRRVYILYCRKAIDYLCDTVLDDSRLKEKFNNLGINNTLNAYQEYYRNLYSRPIETHHTSSSPSSSPNRTEKEKAKHNEASVKDEAGALLINAIGVYKTRIATELPHWDCHVFIVSNTAVLSK